MLFSNLTPLITAAILLLGSTVFAHQPMDTSNSMKRDVHPNSILAVRSDGFSPRVHPRSIFEKRQLSCESPNPVECANDGSTVWCCPSDYACVKSSGKWKCDPNTLGLTRGQKIGIGIGVTVLFFVVCIGALVIFFCCCRKAAQIASAAVNNNNNNNNNPQGMYPPPGQPMMYVGPSPGYDPAAVPLNTSGGDHGKPYVDAPTGYYGQPGQAGYEQYGQQPQQQYQPHPGLQPSPGPAPPYQQPPPPPPGPPQQYTH